MNAKSVVSLIKTKLIALEKSTNENLIKKKNSWWTECGWDISKRLAQIIKVLMKSTFSLFGKYILGSGFTLKKPKLDYLNYTFWEWLEGKDDAEL